jgi:hypothetical protein
LAENAPTLHLKRVRIQLRSAQERIGTRYNVDIAPTAGDQLGVVVGAEAIAFR